MSIDTSNINKDKEPLSDLNIQVYAPKHVVIALANIMLSLWSDFAFLLNVTLNLELIYN